MRAGRRSIRRVVRRGVFAVALLALLAGAVLWLVFQHKPPWYRPVTLDDTGLARVRRELTNLTDWISDQLVRGAPFDLTLAETDVNRWLSALPRTWPETKRSLGRTLSNPGLAFAEGDIRVGAELASRGWRVIASISLALTVGGDGGFLTITPSRPRGGSLPIPRMLLDRPLTRLLARAREDASGRPSGLRGVLRDVPTADALFDGVQVENRFVWPNGRRRFRIAEVRVDDHHLRLRIEPL